MDWEKITSSPLTSSILGGVGGILGSVIQNSYNAKQADKQRAWNETMMAQQNAWNEEMWAKTNEYNSPTNQVQRMRDAGLNPLYYGLDGSAASTIQSAQPLGYERASMSAIDNPIMQALSSASQIAQISNIQANTAKTNNENLTETQTREKIKADIEVAKQNVKNLMSQEGLTNVQKETAEKQLKWLDRINEANIGLTESSKALNEMSKKRMERLLDGEEKIQIKTLEDFEKRWTYMSKEMEKISKETGILQKDLENYLLNHMSSNGIFGVSISDLLRLIVEASESGTLPNQQPVPMPEQK